MADICICENKECPVNKSCLRFTSKPDDLGQVYAFFDHEDGECHHFCGNERIRNDDADI